MRCGTSGTELSVSCQSCFFLLAGLLSVRCAPVSEGTKACNEAKESHVSPVKKLANMSEINGLGTRDWTAGVAPPALPSCTTSSPTGQLHSSSPIPRSMHCPITHPNCHSKPVMFQAKTGPPTKNHRPATTYQYHRSHFRILPHSFFLSFQSLCLHLSYLSFDDTFAFSFLSFRAVRRNMSLLLALETLQL